MAPRNSDFVWKHQSSIYTYEEPDARENHRHALKSIEAWKQIKRQVTRQGTLVPTWKTAVLNVIDGFGWFVITAWMFSNNTQWWAVALMWGIATARGGFVMHMAIHHAVFKSYKLNNTLAIMVQNVLIGASWRWWRHRHNRHHQECNVGTNDPDLKTNPMLVYNEKIETGRITSHQRLLLPLYLSVYTLTWRLFSLQKCVRKGWWSDIAFTVLHWFTFVSVGVRSPYSATKLIGMVLLANAVCGTYLGTVFMLSHFLEEVLDANHGMHQLLHTLVTTRNIQAKKQFGNLFLLWFTGGLNLQIEHHLFPRAPIDKMPELASIVEAVCEKYELPYSSASMLGTLTEIWTRLAEIEDRATTVEKKDV